MFNTVFAMFLR